MRAAGVGDRRSPGALVHALRHTYATRLADDGATASEIMALLGHASLTTSQPSVGGRPAPSAFGRGIPPRTRRRRVQPYGRAPSSIELSAPFCDTVDRQRLDAASWTCPNCPRLGLTQTVLGLLAAPAWVRVVGACLAAVIALTSEADKDHTKRAEKAAAEQEKREDGGGPADQAAAHARRNGIEGARAVLEELDRRVRAHLEQIDALLAPAADED